LIQQRSWVGFITKGKAAKEKTKGWILDFEFIGLTQTFAYEVIYLQGIQPLAVKI